MCSHGGKTFARYWMHNGFVTVEKRKMSKSLGNTLVVHELLKQHPGEVLRYLLLSAHYRQPLDWSEQELDRARRTLDRLYGVLRTADHDYGPFTADEHPGQAFLDALADDLNTPVALAEFNRVARQLARADNRADAQKAAGELLADAALIGLMQSDPDEWFGAASENSEGAAIEELIEKRNQARAGKDFATADAIRDELTAMGVVLEDAGGVTRWRRKDG
jgi:cysteinyl-tRNA synthetase